MCNCGNYGRSGCNNSCGFYGGNNCGLGYGGGYGYGGYGYGGFGCGNNIWILIWLLFLCGGGFWC